MPHLSHSTFQGMVEEPITKYRLPATLHITYCGKTMDASGVAPESKVDCDDCLSAKAWEDIDTMAEQ